MASQQELVDELGAEALLLSPPDAADAADAADEADEDPAFSPMNEEHDDDEEALDELDDLSAGEVPAGAGATEESLDDAWNRCKRELGSVTAEVAEMAKDYNEQKKVFAKFMGVIDGTELHGALLKVWKHRFKEGTTEMVEAEYETEDKKKDTITIAEGLVAMADTVRLPSEHRDAMKKKEALTAESKVLMEKKVAVQTKVLLEREHAKLKRQIERQTGERPPIKRPRLAKSPKKN